MKNLVVCFLLGLMLCSCVATKSYHPSKKYSPQELQDDYHIFQASLEESHPGLYWYTPQDSMNYYFETGRSKLKDSLTEAQFRNILSNVIARIRCGHTSVRSSKAAARYAAGKTSPFPLFIKAWPDTALVTANINRADSHITRGVVLSSIDGKPVNKIIDSLFQHIPSDGYNTTHKYQTLSNGSSFRNLYGAVFGLKKQTNVEYFDTAGVLRSSVLRLYEPKPDSTKKPAKQPGLPKKERRRLELQSMRSFYFDTSMQAAVMEVNTFTKKYGLRRFFKQSFKELREKNITNLVIDLRGNGGGSVTLSNLLTKYLADEPFVIADSLYALRRSGTYARYRNNRLPNWLFLRFLTSKKKDGFYHFGLYENKKFKPKKKNHYNGTTYILTGGNTFSAASLVAKTLAAQDNVIIVGEETGGGAYGNSAWLIPDVTLPNTGVRFRLPLFRLVIDKNADKGRGVQPEVVALPSTEAIRRNKDFKMEKVRELIRAKAGQQ